MGDRVRTWMYLDDMVLANSGQKLPSCIIAHMLHYVPENTLVRVCRYKSKVFDLVSKKFALGVFSWSVTVM